MTDKDISIITVHLDDFSGLEDTLRSISESPFRTLIEWVLIDGSSVPKNDREKSVIGHVAAEADIYVSEPDDGIYDAMNKGTQLAGSRYLLFLNAGDSLHKDFDPESLISALDASNSDMAWGLTSMQYPDGSFGVKKVRRPSWAWYGMPVCHQSVIFTKEMFAESRYDTSLNVAADYDLIAAALGKGARVHLHDSVISIHVAGGLSQRDKHRSLEEEHEVRTRHFGVPSWLSRLVSGFRLQMWKLSDASPGFNRLWRKRL